MSCMSELKLEKERVGIIGFSRLAAHVARACVLVAIAALLVGCQRGIEDGSLPSLPEPSLDSMRPEARGLIGRFGERARAAPNDGSASGRFGMALHAYELNQASIACYRRAIALSPDEWQWPYYLGALYAELGSHSDAAAHLRAVVAMWPSAVTAKVRLGQSLVIIGEIDQAREAFEKVIESEPASAIAHFGLGKALEAQGDSHAALSAYKRSLELEPTAGAVRYALAMLHRNIGQEEEAARQLALIENGNRMAPPIYGSPMVAVRNLRTYTHRNLSPGPRLVPEGDIRKATAMYEKAVELDAEDL